MKGIILVAGKGTRLFPNTKIIPKPLLPIYDKPLIYYSISSLISAGISDILIIVAPRSIEVFKEQLGDGSQWGVKLTYEVQKEPLGIAHALILAEHFVKNDSMVLSLGDNIFYGEELLSAYKRGIQVDYGAMVLGIKVADPSAFGVLEFDANGKVIGIEEKPKNPKSSYIVPGMYFFDNKAISFAKDVKPSTRGELEITSVIEKYIELGELSVSLLDSVKWFDAGTVEDMFKAGVFVRDEQVKLGKLIFSPEQEAYLQGFISLEHLKRQVSHFDKSFYGFYIKTFIDLER